MVLEFVDTAGLISQSPTENTDEIVRPNEIDSNMTPEAMNDTASALDEVSTGKSANLELSFPANESLDSLSDEQLKTSSLQKDPIEPVKRGPGRPRKNPVASSLNESVYLPPNTSVPSVLVVKNIPVKAKSLLKTTAKTLASSTPRRSSRAVTTDIENSSEEELDTRKTLKMAKKGAQKTTKKPTKRQSVSEGPRRKVGRPAKNASENRENESESASESMSRSESESNSENEFDGSWDTEVMDFFASYPEYAIVTEGMPRTEALRTRILLCKSFILMDNLSDLKYIDIGYKALCYVKKQATTGNTKTLIPHPKHASNVMTVVNQTKSIDAPPKRRKIATNSFTLPSKDTVETVIISIDSDDETVRPKDIHGYEEDYDCVYSTLSDAPCMWSSLWSVKADLCKKVLQFQHNVKHLASEVYTNMDECKKPVNASFTHRKLSKFGMLQAAPVHVQLWAPSGTSCSAKKLYQKQSVIMDSEPRVGLTMRTQIEYQGSHAQITRSINSLHETAITSTETETYQDYTSSNLYDDRLEQPVSYFDALTCTLLFPDVKRMIRQAQRDQTEKKREKSSSQQTQWLPDALDQFTFASGEYVLYRDLGSDEIVSSGLHLENNIKIVSGDEKHKSLASSFFYESNISISTPTSFDHGKPLCVISKEELGTELSLQKSQMIPSLVTPTFAANSSALLLPAIHAMTSLSTTKSSNISNSSISHYTSTSLTNLTTAFTNNTLPPPSIFTLETSGKQLHDEANKQETRNILSPPEIFSSERHTLGKIICFRFQPLRHKITVLIQRVIVPTSEPNDNQNHISRTEENTYESFFQNEIWQTSEVVEIPLEHLRGHGLVLTDQQHFEIVQRKFYKNKQIVVENNLSTQSPQRTQSQLQSQAAKKHKTLSALIPKELLSCVFRCGYRFDAQDRMLIPLLFGECSDISQIRTILRSEKTYASVVALACEMNQRQSLQPVLSASTKDVENTEDMEDVEAVEQNAKAISLPFENRVTWVADSPSYYCDLLHYEMLWQNLSRYVSIKSRCSTASIPVVLPLPVVVHSVLQLSFDSNNVDIANNLLRSLQPNFHKTQVSPPPPESLNDVIEDCRHPNLSSFTKFDAEKRTNNVSIPPTSSISSMSSTFTSHSTKNISSIDIVSTPSMTGTPTGPSTEQIQSMASAVALECLNPGRLPVAAGVALPCREREFTEIYHFLRSSVARMRSSGSLYISGMPGTGKTATVHQVLRELEKERSMGILPNFVTVEINGTKLHDPSLVFSILAKSITGKTFTSHSAAEAELEALFKNSGRTDVGRGNEGKGKRQGQGQGKRGGRGGGVKSRGRGRGRGPGRGPGRGSDGNILSTRAGRISKNSTFNITDSLENLDESDYDVNGESDIENGDKTRDTFSNTSSTPFVILIIDELDYLVSKAQSTLYKIFEWAALEQSKMTTVGISNTFDLPERLLPKVASRMGFSRVPFKPYAPNHIEQIVWSRLGAFAKGTLSSYKNTSIDDEEEEEGDTDGSDVENEIDHIDHIEEEEKDEFAIGFEKKRERKNQREKRKHDNLADLLLDEHGNKRFELKDRHVREVFDKEALLLCARKVAAVSGDARRALAICRRAIELAQIRLDKDTYSFSFGDTIFWHPNMSSLDVGAGTDLYISNNGNPDTKGIGGGKVTLTHVERAIRDLFNSSHITMLQMCSVHEQAIMTALVLMAPKTSSNGFEFMSQMFVGDPEPVSIHRLLRRVQSLCITKGISPAPTLHGLQECLKRLVTTKMLQVLHTHSIDRSFVKLAISVDDTKYALRSHPLFGPLISMYLEEC